MKSEKESRKRNLELNKQREAAPKVQKTLKEDGIAHSPPSRDETPVTVIPSNSQSQPEAQFRPVADQKSSYSEKEPVNKSIDRADPNDDLPKGVKVIDEVYELLEDEDVSVKPPERRENSHSNDKEEDLEDPKDYKLVYEQLNTAFCSNIDFERDAILQDFGVDAAQDADDYIDSEEEDFERTNLLSKSTITSANFGTSNIAVSTSENLPVGFFDDQNVDAKARGKLTTKEASEKIRQLSRKKALYLKEAKYIQEKHMESHREQIRLENDILDHQEAFKNLQGRVNDIKANIATSAPENDEGKDQEMEDFLDFDEIHWRSRAIR